MKRLIVLIMLCGMVFTLMSCKKEVDPFLALYLSDVIEEGLLEHKPYVLDDLKMKSMEVHKVYIEAVEDDMPKVLTVMLFLVNFEDKGIKYQVYLQATEFVSEDEIIFEVSFMSEGREEYDEDVVYFNTFDYTYDPSIVVSIYETDSFKLSQRNIKHYLELSK